MLTLIKRFAEKCFPHFRKTRLFRILRPFYGAARYILPKERKKIYKSSIYGEPAIKFFSTNMDRVNAVANMLYDDLSKKTYIKIIKYRQTFKFWNFPFRSNPYPYNQYFKNNFFKYGKNEVLIDCGAFNGDTVESFLDTLGGGGWYGKSNCCTRAKSGKF